MLALRAGLAALGWPVDSVIGAAGGDHGWARRAHRAVILVGNAAGELPRYRFTAGEQQVLLVCGRVGFAAMSRAIGRGADVAVNADQPLPRLLTTVDARLRSGHRPTLEQRRRMVELLRSRAHEAALFASLTARECEILAPLMLGRSAAQIAAAKHVSDATVRTHLQRILRKLGVRSQLAAVAVAHRSCTDQRLLRWTRQIIDFDDD